MRQQILNMAMLPGIVKQLLLRGYRRDSQLIFSLPYSQIVFATWV